MSAAMLCRRLTGSTVYEWDDVTEALEAVATFPWCGSGCSGDHLVVAVIDGRMRVLS